MNPNGSVVILTDVRYMPDMSRNLISYGMLEKSGCSYRGEDYTVTFFKDGQKVISGKHIDGLYYQRKMWENWISARAVYLENLTSRASLKPNTLPQGSWSTFTQIYGDLHREEDQVPED
uniref:Retrovirus-related Pol polyprotein from transposon TNT 1-94 n=1 Tax=Noccaea caerulescens TaxID=107243 RepID=A0A1J3CDF6_NOCCA